MLAYLQLLRPHQWTKNVFLFAGLVFARKLDEPAAVLAAVYGFVCFCLLSSTVYVVNDLHDRQEDRLHPRKCKRPLASGAIGVAEAAGLAVGLVIAGLAGSYYLLGRAFLAVALFYLVLQGLYTFVLKHQVLLDVVLIGLGFVMRAVAGAVAVQAPISPWLVTCTFTLCLFMGFSKRRCELNAMAEAQTDAGLHRKTLALYTPDLLNHMTTLAAGIAAVSFMLYATDKRTVDEFGTNYLIYTLPLVVYAIFRFAFLVEHGLVDGPTEVLLRDRPFQISILLWTMAVLVIIYRGPQMRDWFLATGAISPGSS